MKILSMDITRYFGCEEETTFELRLLAVEVIDPESVEYEEIKMELLAFFHYIIGTILGTATGSSINI
jgi:hypothetical protein